jgi:DNA repair protein SbcD/Mre11
VSDVAYRLGFLSDTHLGYAAKCRTDPTTGLNLRVKDGYIALRDTVTQMIDADLDLVMHGGDLFHRSWPSVGDIVWARKQLQRLADANIPVYGNTGNHDASSERGKSPATAAVHDPARGIHMITDPSARIEPMDGLVLHAVSHYGLAQEERVLPEPINGAVNLLTAHGAALVPGHEIFHCADSPGEQPIGLDLLTNDGFAMHLLGHYHGMGEIIDNVWYAGSAIRRGFSDPAGGRGWLLVTVHTDGSVKVEPQYISQRPQHDLPKIDAKGLTGSDVEERIRANLASVDLGNAIVRQVVTNCSTPIRRGIDQPGLASMAGETLMWMPDFRRPEVTSDDGERTVEGVGASLKTAGSADLPTMYSGWVTDYLSNTDVAEDLVPVVIDEGGRHLKAASADVEAGDFAAPAAAAQADAQDSTDVSSEDGNGDSDERDTNVTYLATGPGGPITQTEADYFETVPAGHLAPARHPATGTDDVPPF